VGAAFEPKSAYLGDEVCGREYVRLIVAMSFREARLKQHVLVS